MRLVGPVTGEIAKAYLFVAVLPYSQYTYVEASSDMHARGHLALMPCACLRLLRMGGHTARLRQPQYRCPEPFQAQ